MFHEGFNGSLLDDDYWGLENFSKSNIKSIRYHSITHRESQMFKPETFVHVKLFGNAILQQISKEYGDIPMYLRIMGINCNQIGKIFNGILYESGIWLTITGRLNDCKKWKDASVTKHQVVYRTEFTEIILVRRIRSLFTMTISLLGLGIMVFLIECLGRFKLEVQGCFNPRGLIVNLKVVLSRILGIVAIQILVFAKKIWMYFAYKLYQ